ncbi:4920_t:CDS:2 [Entrophospora sp. SA101]|nr:4920_t:CDS:2 [Entrophospora sp. SA101]
MDSSNINIYEYEGFIDAEDEDEFNFFLKQNEHEEFEDSEY